MRLAAAVIIVGLLIWAAPVCAEDAVLHYGETLPTEFDSAGDLAYWTDFKTPEEWTDVICSQVRFYGKSYGDNSKVLGSLVIFGPPEGCTELYGVDGDVQAADNDADGEIHKILARRMFDLKDVPSEGGWITLDFDPVKLPGEIAVVIYTYNTDDRGVEIGLSEADYDRRGKSGMFVSKKIKKPEKMTWSHSTDYRQDGRHWAIQVVATNTLFPADMIDTADISGTDFSFHDDGIADGFITSQKHGPMVTYDAGSGKMIDGVYVYGQLVGDWFECDKLAIAYLLDKDFRIVSREVLRYDQFVNEPAWGVANFHDVSVSGRYYVLIEPLAKLQTQLEIGYDTSSENNGSLWGTPGSIGTWNTAAPEEMTNWMIRAHYK